MPNLCLRRLTLNLKAVNTSYVLTLTEEVYLFRDTSTYFDSTLESRDTIHIQNTDRIYVCNALYLYFISTSCDTT